jgi:hypothetical protein
MLNGHHDLANNCTERKRKNSVSSCISSSHSTESGLYVVSEESPNQELQAFMLEEYTLDSEQKCAPCLVYLPIKKQLSNESPFTVKIKLRPLTSDEKEKVKTKSQCGTNVNDSSSSKTDQTQSKKEVESSSRPIEHNEREENPIENGKSAIAFSEGSNAEIKLEISSED